ncbi:hypothetical protein [Dactylosporangium sp. NPDC049140]|uniref:hypothetical protein n=1 Tax=Dactylosporangium sp. NPDC049140 TaxID=3155647 RepID=UPI0033E1EE37
MPAWLRWSVVAAVAIAVVAAAGLVVVNRSLGGPRKPIETLFVPPTSVSLLASEQWENGPSLTDGDLVVRRWTNVRTRAYFEQSVTTHASGFGALYGYSAEDPRINDREDLSSGGVHDAPLDVALAADQARIYCRQAEQPGRREPCSRWVYWSRYGRYTIEVAYREPELDARRFSRMVQQVDANIAAALGG